MTGASGFLGNSILRNSHKNNKYAAIIRSSTNLDVFQNKLSDKNLINFEKKDSEVLQKIKEFKPDVLIHCACSYGRKNETSEQILNSNFSLGIKVLKYLIKLDKNILFLNIGTPLKKNTNEYALTKNFFLEYSELLLKEKFTKIKIIHLLPQHFFGYGDDETKFTSFVINSLKKNIPELHLTSGEQVRDFFHIEDLISAIDVIIKNRNEIKNFKRIEIGSGKPVTVKDFVELSKKLIGSNTSLKFGSINLRENEVMEMKADISYLKSLGWKFKYPLKTAIEKSIK